VYPADVQCLQRETAKRCVFACRKLPLPQTILGLANQPLSAHIGVVVRTNRVSAANRPKQRCRSGASRRRDVSGVVLPPALPGQVARDRIVTFLCAGAATTGRDQAAAPAHTTRTLFMRLTAVASDAPAIAVVARRSPVTGVSLTPPEWPGGRRRPDPGLPVDPCLCSAEIALPGPRLHDLRTGHSAFPPTGRTERWPVPAAAGAPQVMGAAAAGDAGAVFLQNLETRIGGPARPPRLTAADSQCSPVVIDPTRNGKLDSRLT
jgi:hypothetical protein